jgi:hypothetical protein
LVTIFIFAVVSFRLPFCFSTLALSIMSFDPPASVPQALASQSFTYLPDGSGCYGAPFVSSPELAISDIVSCTIRETS